LRCQLDLRQFKLADGDEIMCEVVEFHEEEDALVIRKTLKLVMMDNMQNGIRYFAFRPFMMYQLESTSFQVIQCAHIIAEAAPSQELINEYFTSLENLTSDDTDDENMDEIRKRAEKKLKEYLATQMELKDSSNENIISFPSPSDKIH
jgi:hypothetical protein